MLCNECVYKDDCGWYGSLKNIKNEIILGLEADDPLGHVLMENINDYELNQCEYFGSKENTPNT